MLKKAHKIWRSRYFWAVLGIVLEFVQLLAVFTLRAETAGRIQVTMESVGLPKATAEIPVIKQTVIRRLRAALVAENQAAKKLMIVNTQRFVIY